MQHGHVMRVILNEWEAAWTSDQSLIKLVGQIRQVNYSKLVGCAILID